MPWWNPPPAFAFTPSTTSPNRYIAITAVLLSPVCEGLAVGAILAAFFRQDNCLVHRDGK